ncbi:hypothetical protein BC827DRAFT_471981 [Russula dissimulans]|nr:hypothetical protein BC827DRAFT_471981 [Russula dissimulans]
MPPPTLRSSLHQRLRRRPHPSFQTPPLLAWHCCLCRLLAGSCRLLRDFVTLADREVSVLKDTGDSPSVIRYYHQEAHANFLCIALELCPASLADVIERPDQFCEIANCFNPKHAVRCVPDYIWLQAPLGRV